MTKRSYRTDQVVVQWDSSRCIHTGFCLKALPAVFDTSRRPWVDIDAADADAIAAAVEQCPSGALQYERLDGPGEQPDVPASTVPWPSGPLMVRGDVEVRTTRGELLRAGYRMALCRCGHSQNPPFCDMSHVEAEFRDDPRASLRQHPEADRPSDLSEKPSV